MKAKKKKTENQKVIYEVIECSVDDVKAHTFHRGT